MSTTKKATLEDAWSIIRELGESHKKSEEAQRKGEETLREAHRKTAEEMQRTQIEVQKTQREVQKTQREVQKTQREVQTLNESLSKTNGKFDTRWGKFVENLVHGDLIKLLRNWKIEVVRIQPRLIYPPFEGRRGGEFDLVAINGGELVIVEVKSTLEKADIYRFIDKIKIFKETPTEYQSKTIYGGMAYLEVIKKADELAEEQGLFVIKAHGGESNISTIINGRDFSPKVF